MALRRYESFGMLDLFDLVRMPEVWPHLTTYPMRVEEFMDGTTFVVRAELPGVDPDKDVELTVENGLLRIKAERREEKTVDKGKTYRSGFRYGTLFRGIPRAGRGGVPHRRNKRGRGGPRPLGRAVGGRGRLPRPLLSC